MTRPRVALIVDHPQRDLAGMVIVAAELCRRGAVCYLVPHNGQARDVWALAPDYVLLNFARRGCDEFAGAMARAGIGFGVLDTEGAIWDSPDAYAELLWGDADLRRAVQPMCAWGPKMADYLAAHSLFSAAQLRVTGCPRFDFYHESWQRVIAVPPNGDSPHVLINTNFYTANSRFVAPERNIAQLQEVFGWSGDRADSLVARERDAIAGVVALTRSLACDFPQATIVLRPHPFERPQTYEAPLRDLPNVRINTAGPVQGQICGAAVVIQRSCTTALEAAFAGVPTLSPRWISAGVEIPMAEAVSLPCATYETMRDAVAAALARRFAYPPVTAAAIASVTADWFHTIDGCAHLRVADAVSETVATGAGRVDRAVCLRELYGLDSSGLEWRDRLGRWTRRQLHLTPDWSFARMRMAPSDYWETTNKAFACVDVATILSRARAVRGADRTPTLSVALARDIGECVHGYHGRAIRLSRADRMQWFMSVPPLRAVSVPPPADIAASFSAGAAVRQTAADDEPPGVSVVVCTHRRPASVSAFLDSLRGQRPTADALHVIDASPDATTELAIRERADLDEIARSIDYVRVAPHAAGLTRQRNLALARVRTDLVAFFDDDVVLMEGCLGQLTSAIRNDPALAGVGAVAANERHGPSMLWRMRRACRIVDRLQPGRYCRSGMSVSWSVLRADEPVSAADWLPGYAMLWRTRVARDVGFHSTYHGYANGEDLEFGLRAARHGRLKIEGDARLDHRHDDRGRPDAFTLGFTTVRNAWDIHRRCLQRRGLPDIVWFAYAFGADTILQALALLRPPGPSWRLPYAFGRLAALAGAPPGWYGRRSPNS